MGSHLTLELLMSGIKSLEVTFNPDGSLADWTFNGGQRTGTRKEMKLALDTLHANLTFLEMAFDSRMRELAQSAVSPKTDKPKPKAAKATARTRSGAKLK